MKKIINCIRDRLTGDAELINEQMSVMYSGVDAEEHVEKYRSDLWKRYLLVAAVAVLLCLISAISSLSANHITSISKSDTEEQNVHVQVEAEYRDQKVISSGSLNIPKRLLTDEEKEELLSNFAKSLYEIVPVDESGLRIVKGNLDLPESDGMYGIDVVWNSSDPVLISAEGLIDVTSLKTQYEDVTLSAELSYDGVKKNISFDVRLQDEPKLYEISIKRRINEAATALSESDNNAIVKLPDELGNDISVCWSEKKESNVFLIAVITVAAAGGIYSGRYKKIRKKVKEYRAAVISEFPAVIDKLVLLLNSGLTVYSALMRISEDYENNEVYSNYAISGEIADIGRRVRNTNASVLDEWKRFASRMESADMLRFCTILEDNINKGSELSLKLENESRNLLAMRKKDLQQMIRMIDSKMMVPMMIMLFSLIVITISPVMTGF